MSPTANPALSKSDVNKDALEAAADPTTVTSTGSGNEVDAPDNDNAHEDSQFVEVDFYNPNDGLKGRAGGVYLDVQQRVDAEETRAKSEGRRPDFNNPPANAGTPLVDENHRVDTLPSNPASQVVAPVKEVNPVSSLPVDIGVASEPTDLTYQKQLADEDVARNADGDVGATTDTVTL